MIDAARFTKKLEELGVGFFTGVPDSLLKDFCAYVMAELPAERHVIAANEGASVGLAIGYYLKTQKPALVYMQNSGFGNAVNPLLSLADNDVYGIPMVLLVGWRGQPGVKDEPQHVKQGRIMTDMLDAMKMPWSVLPKDAAQCDDALKAAVDLAQREKTPVVLLVEKDSFDKFRMPAHVLLDLPSREEALIALVKEIGNDAIQVSTTGMLSRELFEYRNNTGANENRDFLTVGGMGHCSSIALGIAMQEKNREVWCLDGDGALLMHMGGLPVMAAHASKNFFHVIFNNGVHDSVGGQPDGGGSMPSAGAGKSGRI
jgi:phosphonopyruvate decarboxylase